jgi:hypothetical protein
MRTFRPLGIAMLVLLAWAGLASAQQPFTKGTWTALKHAPPSAVGHMLLLTDGSVLVNSFYYSVHPDPWYRLVPDSTGSYINGTWHSAGTLPSGYNPLYFASAVLKNDRVVIMGGEYNNGSAVWTTMGALYTPGANTWTSLSAPSGWTTVGDAQSIVLPNGRFMLANCCTTDEALLTLSGSTATWTPTGTGKFDVNDEEGWTLLPNGNVLAVDAYVGSYDPAGTHSEIYKTSTGTWSSAGSTGVQLWDSAAACGGPGVATYELGPAVLRPNGTVFYTGANSCAPGHTAIYHTGTGTWSAGPDFPIGSVPPGLDIADGPAALLPDGNVLMDASPGIFMTGSEFFEWDGTALRPTSAPPNAPTDSSYYGNMVVLPTGQVMFTDFSSSVEIYTPAGAPCAGCAPTITSVAPTLTHGSYSNIIKGTQFNGLSQGAAYGDDNQSATNYPLVRVTDSTGRVWYCRTHNFSTMGVHTGATIVSAEFDIPSSIALGSATLVVVANGIPSAPATVTII